MAVAAGKLAGNDESMWPQRSRSRIPVGNRRSTSAANIAKSPQDPMILGLSPLGGRV